MAELREQDDEQDAKIAKSGESELVASPKQDVGNSSDQAVEKKSQLKPELESQLEALAVEVEVDESRSSYKKSVSFYLAFLSLMIMVLIVSLDATILAVAIPAITRELTGTTIQAFWASISFTLAVVIIQPIYTNVSNIMGRKICLYTAFVLFGVGSIVFAVSHSMGVLIFGRVLQGLGGGGLDVLSEIITADITTLKERAFWIGMLSIPMSLGCILGPVLGALFSEYANWRWIGWINLPLVAIALVLAFFFMRLKKSEKSLISRLGKIDWIGMGLFCIACTLISLPLSWGGVMYAWGSWNTIVPLVIGAVVMVGFAVYERYPEEAIFPYRIFASRTASITILSGFIYGLILYTLLLYLPLFYQAVYLETALQSAVSILPFCVLVMVMTGVAALVVDYFRHYLVGIWVGWILVTVGTGLFALWKESYSGTTLRTLSAVFQIISGIGIGTTFPLTCIPMQASAPSAADQGLAIGIMVAFRLFGALIGLAIGSATFNNSFAHAIASVDLPESLQQLVDPNEAVAYIPYLREIQGTVSEDLLTALREAYRTPFRDIYIILAAFGALAFVSSLFIKELTLESEEVGDQHYED